MYILTHKCVIIQSGMCYEINLWENALLNLLSCIDTIPVSDPILLYGK